MSPDFGFATVTNGRVAYLVMEYLDGCTLGDVLAEEQRLPLDWVVDILEQVCSAVHEAHQQGIIHRDLKPDNIWLEPTRLGGYRVKVLDFGIAKLGEASVPMLSDDSAATIIDGFTAIANEDAPAPAGDSEKATLIQSLPDDGRTQHAGGGSGAAVKTAVYDSSEEAGTRIFAAKTGVHDAPNLTAKFAGEHDELHDSDGTLLFDNGTHSSGTRSAHATTAEAGSALTRVGAIMGTPLYMSPEQCSGGQIDMRSDIYSLGVIAYQMLAGEPPFSGNTSTVMRAHREEPPTHLRERTTKIPKRVAGVVMSSLSKTPSERPATAFALASSLRGQAEGVGALYRRAFSLYSEYFPKFLKLSFLAHIPVIVTSILLCGMLILDHVLPHGGIIQRVAIIGVTAIIGTLEPGCLLHRHGCDLRRNFNHRCAVGRCSATSGKATVGNCDFAKEVATVYQHNDQIDLADYWWLSPVHNSWADNAGSLCALGADRSDRGSGKEGSSKTFARTGFTLMANTHYRFNTSVSHSNGRQQFSGSNQIRLR
jgi:serine/threonine protein kinase